MHAVNRDQEFSHIQVQATAMTMRGFRTLGYTFQSQASFRSPLIWRGVEESFICMCLSFAGSSYVMIAVETCCRISKEWFPWRLSRYNCTHPHNRTHTHLLVFTCYQAMFHPTEKDAQSIQLPEDPKKTPGLPSSYSRQSNATLTA